MGNAVPFKKPVESELWARQLYKIVKKQGVTIQLKDLRIFIEKIQKISPWLQNVELDKDTWQVVGEQMTAYEKECPKELGELDLLIFSIIKNAFGALERPKRQFTEESKTQSKLSSKEEEWVPPPPPPAPSYSLYLDLSEFRSNLPVLKETKDMGRYKSEIKGRNLSGLEKAVCIAREKGEDVTVWTIYPVTEIPDPNVPGQTIRSHTPIPWKHLKDLKAAVVQYGPTAPFVLAQLDQLAQTFTLCPNDWKLIVRACLSAGQAVVWRAEFAENARQEAARLGNGTRGVDQAFASLVGEGQYETTDAQLTYGPDCAKRAWGKLVSEQGDRRNIAQVKQGPKESFPDFVARMQEAVAGCMGSVEGADKVLKLMLRENANHDCKKAMLGLPANAGLEKMLSRCERVGSEIYKAELLAGAMSIKREGIFLQHLVLRILCFVKF